MSGSGGGLGTGGQSEGNQDNCNRITIKNKVLIFIKMSSKIIQES